MLQSRYADDAERIERAFHNRFNTYGLELHRDKSQRISFGRYERENAKKQNRRANTFDFLGITHYTVTSREKAGLRSVARQVAKSLLPSVEN